MRNNDKGTHIKNLKKKCIESHRREAKIKREYERIIEKETGGQKEEPQSQEPEREESNSNVSKFIEKKQK